MNLDGPLHTHPNRNLRALALSTKTGFPETCKPDQAEVSAKDFAELP